MSYSANLIHQVNFPAQVGLGYGSLYNWYAVNTVNFAPSGWHVPTKAEYDALLTYLGGEGVVSNELKETGTTHWNASNTGTNTSNFTGVGSGMRSNAGSFFLLKDHSYLWCNSAFDSSTSYYKRLVLNTDAVLDGTGDNKYGFSVRLIKDDSSNPGTLTDYDGNVYDTVDINGQIWTKQNWKCTRLNNGTSLTKVTNAGTWAGLTTEGYCSYNNDDNNV